MKVSRFLGTSAATAVLVLTPSAALAADGGYGEGPDTAPNQGSVGGSGSGSGDVAGTAGRTGTNDAVSDSSGGLPSTGSTALDTMIAGAGLALVLGGGAMVVASRRREAQPA